MEVNPKPTAEGTLEGKVHRFPVRVYYENTDAGGVVYHADYLCFLERARTDFLRAAGITHALLREEAVPVAFAVRRAEVDFVKPAVLEDLLTIHTAFAEVRGPRFFITQRIQRGDEILVQAELEVACITLEGKAARPPKVLVNALSPFTGGVLKST